MTTQQKSQELLEYKAILLATLDYLQKREEGSMVYDDHDPLKDTYEELKLQVQKYFETRRLDRLQKRLAIYIKGLQSHADLDFSTYIKEKTGYDLDIFSDLIKNVEIILNNKGILDDSQLQDVTTLSKYYKTTSRNSEDLQKLDALVQAYLGRNQQNILQNKRKYWSHVIYAEGEGFKSKREISFTGPKPNHFQHYEHVSPNGRLRLDVTEWGDKKHASTFVDLVFPKDTGRVYQVKGVAEDLKVTWKDNSLIQIETKDTYEVIVQHKVVRSFADVVTIEYITS